MKPERPRSSTGFFGSILLSLLLAPGYACANPAGAAPDFSLPDLRDQHRTIALSDYRGKAVYLDFWSAWCAPCRDNLPLLGELHRLLGGDDFQVITVNVDVDPRDGQRLMEELSIDYVVASDVASLSAKKYDLTTLPAAFVIDREGVIRTGFPKLNRQSFSAVKAGLTELIRQDSKAHARVN